MTDYVTSVIRTMVPTLWGAGLTAAEADELRRRWLAAERDEQY
ncbi:MAG: hypothetical protein ACREXJ_00210 [Gammaproteobacteria bacterium]